MEHFLRALQLRLYALQLATLFVVRKSCRTHLGARHFGVGGGVVRRSARGEGLVARVGLRHHALHPHGLLQDAEKVLQKLRAVQRFLLCSGGANQKNIGSKYAHVSKTCCAIDRSPHAGNIPCKKYVSCEEKCMVERKQVIQGVDRTYYMRKK